MPRIRTIKPEFPQSESVGRLSRDARLLFIQLWTLVDDSSRARASSRLLASLLYPYDEDSGTLMDGWLSELEDGGFIRRYRVDDNDYLDIPKWLKHQKIDRPSESRLPAFDEPSSDTREPSRALVARPRTVDLGSGTVDHGPRTVENDRGVSPLGGDRPPLTGPRVCPPSAKHAWCDGRMHVPGFIHQEFQRTARDDFDLYRWYADTDLAWAEQPIGDDGPTFWRARWREHHGTTRKSEGELINDARQKRNEEAGAEFERELQGGT